ncbi:MAG TPA: OB-fold domain-containing protein [Acidimicrobiales bacterium]|nr:OB-fold domain-containing protein [Acidimicrobiales bacterium]
MSATGSYLPAGLPAPGPAPDGLDAPWWAATAEHRLVVQRCAGCGRHQWGPEWVCHRCRSFDLDWVDVAPRGVIYSWERVWHPVHPALAEACPYVVVLVELPHADGVRMVGNLLGEPTDDVVIGSDVEAVFEDHDGDTPYTLVQWRRLA